MLGGSIINEANVVNKIEPIQATSLSGDDLKEIKEFEQATQKLSSAIENFVENFQDIEIDKNDSINENLSLDHNETQDNYLSENQLTNLKNGDGS